ncbi:hypothetical protein [uncultured Pseudoteredinibacter sp.]|uniref:hypothetical protein n=1 Tax=uncultured Pseudoteredinibacter sp. TaxID=1641701 RepID=UPI002626BCBB|nr:hypothetical protein [uncultured Pseudoteredinibacter sp.]
MIDHNPKDMAPAIWFEALIFLSSYYPLFLILLIRDVDHKVEGISVGCVSLELSISGWALSLFLLSSLSSLIVGTMVRKLLMHQEGGTSVKVKKVNQIRGDMLNYTLPFLIGLFAFDYEDYQSIASLLIFLVFIFSFVRKEQISLLNPMFLLMGVRLYDVEYKEVGRAAIGNGTVLCLGKVVESNEILQIKETAGIYFIFPKK